jgi:Protein of unknown function (DUF1579)
MIHRKSGFGLHQLRNCFGGQGSQCHQAKLAGAVVSAQIPSDPERETMGISSSPNPDLLDSRSFCASIRGTSERRIQMSGPQMLVSFVLACASSVIVAGAQSQTTRGPEVKKLAVMVGRFTVEDEVKGGAMGPNSPAMKFSGTDDCRWTAGGFAVICEAALYRPGRKYSEASFVYYDPTSKTYRYQAVDSSGGIENKTGTVNGDVWTWLGESIFGGKLYHTRYTMRFVSADSYEYTDESGESESSMKVFVSGKETRVAATKPAKSQSTQ